MAQRISSEVVEGDVVDFYIEEQWHEGTIIKKEENDDQEILLTLQSAEQDDLTRCLTLNSRLLAKHHTYTK